MKRMKLLTAVILLLVGSFAFTIQAADMPRTVEKNVKKGIIKAWRLKNTNYCHLKFPSIKTNTLLGGKPELQDPEYGSIIDYYGPCDHDPLGEVEVEKQTRALDRLRTRE